jgi:hypothetical protein
MMWYRIRPCLLIFLSSLFLTDYGAFAQRVPIPSRSVPGRVESPLARGATEEPPGCGGCRAPAKRDALPSDIAIELRRTVEEKTGPRRTGKIETVPRPVEVENKPPPTNKTEIFSYLNSEPGLESRGVTEFLLKLDRDAKMSLDLIWGSTQRMTLFHAERSEGRMDLTFGVGEGVRISISDGELAQLKQGKLLPPDHLLTQFLKKDPEKALVLHIDPKDAASSETDAFLFVMQRGYPSRRIYRDPLSAETAHRADLLGDFRVGNPEEVVALVADQSFGVPHNHTIKNIVSELRERMVRVETFREGVRWDGRRGKAVLIITGHTSDQLAAFVDAVGVAGFFQENYVVFNSCESPLTKELAARISNRYGAVAIFCHEGTIAADKVQDYLIDLTERIEETASDPASREARPSFEVHLRESLRKFGLNGIWTICWITLSAPGHCEVRHG